MPRTQASCFALPDSAGERGLKGGLDDDGRMRVPNLRMVTEELPGDRENLGRRRLSGADDPRGRHRVERPCDVASAKILIENRSARLAVQGEHGRRYG